MPRGRISLLTYFQTCIIYNNIGLIIQVPFRIHDYPPSVNITYTLSYFVWLVFTHYLSLGSYPERMWIVSAITLFYHWWVTFLLGVEFMLICWAADWTGEVIACLVHFPAQWPEEYAINSSSDRLTSPSLTICPFQAN